MKVASTEAFVSKLSLILQQAALRSSLSSILKVNPALLRLTAVASRSAVTSTVPSSFLLGLRMKSIFPLWDIIILGNFILSLF